MTDFVMTAAALALCAAMGIPECRPATLDRAMDGAIDACLLNRQAIAENSCPPPGCLVIGATEEPLPVVAYLCRDTPVS